MADFGSAASGLAWSIGLSAAGFSIGAVSDILVSPILEKNVSQSPAARALIQFSVGLLALRELSRLVVPQDVQAPVGDALLLIFFVMGQPKLVKDLSGVYYQFASLLGKAKNGSDGGSGSGSSASTPAAY
jgi:hypothetical protein